MSTKYLLITHTFSTGPTQELRDYFIKNKTDFSFIEHPFTYNKKQKQSQITIYRNGEKHRQFKGIRLGNIEVINYVTDILNTLYFSIRTNEKYDVCIAADNLNSLGAWLLKKFGYIKKLAYWTIDFTPNRFNERTLNRIYSLVDKFCCYHADLIWNSSVKMREARKNAGVNMQKCAPDIIVCDGCHFKDIERVPDANVNKYKLVFMGQLLENKGTDLIINAMPELIRRFPQISLTVVGTGPEEKKLKELVKNLDLGAKVIFTGYIKEHGDLERIIASCGIAIAPYVPDPNSYSFYSDVGKVKVYAACGLPILITRVPEIALEVQNTKAGLIFEYDLEGLIEKVVMLLANDADYYNYRHRAIDLARRFDWDNVLKNAVSETLTKLCMI